MWGIEITAKLRPSPPCTLECLVLRRRMRRAFTNGWPLKRRSGHIPGAQRTSSRSWPDGRLEAACVEFFRVRALGKAEDEHVRVAAPE